MTATLRKVTAIGLVAVFLSQAVLATQVESSIWEQRRKALAAGDESQAPQYASLPSQLNPSALLKQLPSVNQTLPTTNSWVNSNKKFSSDLPKNFKSLIEALPQIYCSIQDIYNSGNNQNPPVLLVQDVHLNTEAQNNIALTLQELIDQDQLAMVGVEGAFSQFDFNRFRKYPNKEINKAVIEEFLQKNLLAAPSYVGITSAKDPPLFLGVDDKDHYNANLEALYAAHEAKVQLAKNLSVVEQNVQNAKKSNFSPELIQFDDLRTAYHKGNVPFGVYVKKLSGYDVDRDFVVDQFLEAYGMESSIDFKEVEAERKSVIEKLTKVLSEKQISELVTQSLAYRLGKMSFGDYYQGLKELCESKGIKLSRTPAFENYVRYVLLSDGIKADKLFIGIDKLENQIVQNLAVTPKEKSLVTMSEHISLTEKLLDFSLTPNEWTKYLNSQKSLKELSNQETFTEALRPFENFYLQADIRSHKMVEKLSGQKVSGNKAFVLGGFHTPKIAALLRDEKISYIIVSPKITKIENGSGSSYLSVFAQAKTPLDRLFAGEKLFLYPDYLGIGTHTPPTQRTEAIVDGVLDLENRAHSSASETAQDSKKSEGDQTHSFHHDANQNKNGGLKILHTVVQKNAASGFLPANIFQSLNQKLGQFRTTAKGFLKGLFNFLYILTHPLAAPFTETIGLWGGIGLAKSLLGVAAAADPTGLSWLAILSVSLIFSLAHSDLWSRSSYRNGQITFGQFADKFLQRLLGGVVLTIPIMFMPGVEGLITSGLIHLGWNSLFVFKNKILQTKVGQNKLVKNLLNRLLPLAAADPTRLTPNDDNQSAAERAFQEVIGRAPTPGDIEGMKAESRRSSVSLVEAAKSYATFLKMGEYLNNQLPEELVTDDFLNALQAHIEENLRGEDNYEQFMGKIAESRKTLQDFNDIRIVERRLALDREKLAATKSEAMRKILDARIARYSAQKEKLLAANTPSAKPVSAMSVAELEKRRQELKGQSAHQTGLDRVEQEMLKRYEALGLIGPLGLRDGYSLNRAWMPTDDSSSPITRYFEEKYHSDKARRRPFTKAEILDEAAAVLARFGPQENTDRKKQAALEKKLQQLNGELEKLNRDGLPKVIHIGDQHGNPKFLKQVLERVERGEVDQVVFHGDLFDRGSNNVECLRLVQELQKKLGDNFVALMGNHDAWLVRAILLGDLNDFVAWVGNGGSAFLKEKGLSEITNEIKQLLANKFMDRRAMVRRLEELRRSAANDPDLRRAAFWLLKNARMAHIDQMGFLHVHAGIRINSNGDVVFNDQKGAAAKQALLHFQQQWELMQKELSSEDDVFGQQEGIKALMEVGHDLFWARGEEWYENLIDSDPRSDAAVEREWNRIPESDKAMYRKQGVSDEKLKAAVRAQVVQKLGIAPKVNEEKLNRALAQLGVRGIFFGHEHKQDLMDLGGRIFCIDADGNQDAQGFVQFQSNGMKWVANGRGTRDVRSKNHFVAQIMREIVDVRNELGLTVEAEQERLRQPEMKIEEVKPELAVVGSVSRAPVDSQIEFLKQMLIAFREHTAAQLGEENGDLIFERAIKFLRAVAAGPVEGKEMLRTRGLNQELENLIRAAKEGDTYENGEFLIESGLLRGFIANQRDIREVFPEGMPEERQALYLLLARMLVAAAAADVVSTQKIEQVGNGYINGGAQRSPARESAAPASANDLRIYLQQIRESGDTTLLVRHIKLILAALNRTQVEGGAVSNEVQARAMAEDIFSDNKLTALLSLLATRPQDIYRAVPEGREEYKEIAQQLVEKFGQKAQNTVAPRATESAERTPSATDQVASLRSSLQQLRQSNEGPTLVRAIKVIMAVVNNGQVERGEPSAELKARIASPDIFSDAKLAAFIGIVGDQPQRLFEAIPADRGDYRQTAIDFVNAYGKLGNTETNAKATTTAKPEENLQRKASALVTYLKSIQSNTAKLARTLKLMLATADNDPAVLSTSGLPDEMKRRIFGDSGALDQQMVVKFLRNIDKVNTVIPSGRAADYQPIAQDLLSAMPSTSGNTPRVLLPGGIMVAAVGLALGIPLLALIGFSAVAWLNLSQNVKRKFLSFVKRLPHRLMNSMRRKNTGEATQMKQGAEWLATIGVALQNRNASDLLGPAGTIDLGNKFSAPNSEVALLSNLNRWVGRPEFQEMLVNALSEQNRTSATPITKARATELAEVLVAVVLANNSPSKISSKASDRHLLIFERSSSEKQQQLRVQIMATLLAAGLNATSTVVTDESSKRDAQLALQYLRSVGFDLERVTSEAKFKEVMTKEGRIDTSQSDIANASLVVAPKSRLQSGMSNKFRALEDLVPLKDLVSLTNMIRAMQAALVAA